MATFMQQQNSLRSTGLLQYPAGSRTQPRRPWVSSRTSFGRRALRSSLLPPCPTSLRILPRHLGRHNRSPRSIANGTRTLPPLVAIPSPLPLALQPRRQAQSYPIPFRTRDSTRLRPGFSRFPSMSRIRCLIIRDTRTLRCPNRWRRHSKAQRAPMPVDRLRDSRTHGQSWVICTAYVPNVLSCRTALLNNFCVQSYVPYPGYSVRAPNADQVQPPGSQPPLLPTGFIQGEQGTLIAVYHPDALDQYMSGTQQGAQPPTQHHPQNPPAWSNYPHHPYPFNLPMPHVMGGPPHQLQSNNGQAQLSANVGWAPGSSPLELPGSQHQQPNIAPGSFAPTFNRQPGTTFRGNYETGGGQANTPPPKRQHRRDQQNTYNMNRNNQSRTYPTRYSRGMNTSYPSLNTENVVPQQLHTRPSQFGPVSEDWSQWAPGRP